MMDMMAGMALLWILALLLLGLVIAAGIFVGVRAAHRLRGDRESPLEVLERRLASGEISEQEYYERESILRSSRTPGRGRG